MTTISRKIPAMAITSIAHAGMESSELEDVDDVVVAKSTLDGKETTLRTWGKGRRIGVRKK